VNGTNAATVNCTTSCSATVNALVGSDTFAVNLYGGQNGTGSLLSTGSLTQTIVANTANAVSVRFNGVVASLQIASPPVATPGTAGSVAIAVNALDAAGNIIIGPGAYVNASGALVTIALSNSDTSGNSTLSQTSITQPTTGIKLNYTAAFDANPTITASATGFTNALATIAFPAPTFTISGSAPFGLQNVTATTGAGTTGATQFCGRHGQHRDGHRIHRRQRRFAGRHGCGKRR
jgi:hypothetical protein